MASDCWKSVQEVPVKEAIVVRFCVRFICPEGAMEKSIKTKLECSLHFFWKESGALFI